MKQISLTVNGVDYKITPSGNRFDLYKLGKSEKGTEKSSNMGYHMTLIACIDKVAKDSMSRPDEVLSLKQYVERYEASLNEVKELINEIEY